MTSSPGCDLKKVILPCVGLSPVLCPSDVVGVESSQFTQFVLRLGRAELLLSRRAGPSWRAGTSAGSAVALAALVLSMSIALGSFSRFSRLSGEHECGHNKMIIQ